MEIPGFTPSRRVEEIKGGYIVYVTPPRIFRLPEVSVLLTPDQYLRYRKWRDQKMMIQEALPELSPSEREKLMTGLGDEDFQRMTRDND